MKSIALLWNRGMRPLSIIVCLVLEHKGKSRSSALTGNSDWTGSWGDLGGVWHLALPFDEYFRKFWYPHIQWFQRSTDNCGKIHVRIILGHPIASQSQLDLPADPAVGLERDTGQRFQLRHWEKGARNHVPNPWQFVYLQGVSQITLQTQNTISPEKMLVFSRKFHCITGRSYLTTY